MNKMPQQDRQEEFTRLLVTSQNRIFAFIFTLIQNRSAAEDVLQEVSVVLWKKFDRFEPDTDFAAWAMSVARFSVLEWRRAQRKLPMALDDQLLEVLADEAMATSVDQQERIEALQQCMTKVTPQERDLLVRRYAHGTPVADIAQRENRTRMAIYKRLNKIHGQLLECIRHRLSTELTP